MKVMMSAKEDGCIRLEEAGGASLTLDVSGEEAYVLYIHVPEQQRRQGIAKVLLAGAEKIAVKEGRKRMHCDFYQETEGFRELMEAEGYAVSEKEQVVFVRTEQLVSSTGVKKTLRAKFDGISVESFDEMLIFQWQEIAEFLQNFNYGVELNEMVRFEPSLSFAVYDEEYKPRAVFLVTAHEEELLVEFMFGFSTDKQQYVITAAKEFVKAIIDQDLVDTYPKISMIAVNSSVIPLLRRLLDKGYEVSESGKVLRADKELTVSGSYPEEGGTIHDATFWMRQAITGARYQCNINEKYRWLDDTARKQQ